MIKKAIAFLLSFVFIFALFSGCSKINNIINKKITLEQLLSANDVDTLIDIYGSIKVTQTEPFTSSVEHYFRKDNRTVSAFKSIDSTGFESYSGCYGAYNFYFENDHYICCDEVDSHKDPSEFIFNKSISALFLDGKISNIIDNGETYSFSIKDSNKIESGSYIVDKSTLAIQSCNVSSEGSEVSVNITYGENLKILGSSTSGKIQPKQLLLLKTRVVLGPMKTVLTIRLLLKFRQMLNISLNMIMIPSIILMRIALLFINIREMVLITQYML